MSELERNVGEANRGPICKQVEVKVEPIVRDIGQRRQVVQKHLKYDDFNQIIRLSSFKTTKRVKISWMTFKTPKTGNPTNFHLRFPELTLAKHNPMVPVPQQMSRTVVSGVTAPSSMAVRYNVSAPAVFTWKKASGLILNVRPRIWSVMCVEPNR